VPRYIACNNGRNDDESRGRFRSTYGLDGYGYLSPWLGATRNFAALTCARPNIYYLQWVNFTKVVLGVVWV
jgi:hypothetical protein